METIINAAAVATDVIKDGSTATFMADVIEASRETPVIVDFWAPWCGPCKQLGPALEKVVTDAAGAVRLVKINVDENQELAGQLRVQSIPAVFAFKNGQPVDGFAGALPESQIRQFVGRLTGGAGVESPLQEALDTAKQMAESGDHEGAAGVYSRVYSRVSSVRRARVRYVYCVYVVVYIRARYAWSRAPPRAFDPWPGENLK